MPDMEDLYELFFEVSSEDRHRILLQLEKEAMNVTRLSKELGLGAQECSRHVTRLGKVGLTQKDVDGLLRLTSYGELVLRLLPGYEFVSRHRGYFSSHSLAGLPREFVGRIGELADSGYTSDVMVAISGIEAMMRGAEEYIWIIHDQYLMSAYPLASEAVGRGVRFRTIDPKVYRPPVELKGEVSANDRRILTQAMTDGLLKTTTLERFDVFLWMSEREVAVIAFPTLDGMFDYLGFTSTNENAHKWCADLFEYYWARAEPKHEVTFARPYERNGDRSPL
jgi:predicted transcriptional regulator